MNHTDNQGRGDRPQMPEGAGFIYWAIVGLGLWCAIFDVISVWKGWL